MEHSIQQRRILLTLAGTPVSHLASTGLLLTTLIAIGTGWRLGMEMTAAALLIRLLVGFTGRPEPVLAARPVRKYLRQVLDSETKYILSFTAAAFLLAWPLSAMVLAIYAVGNLLMQLGLYSITRSILRYLSGASAEEARKLAKNRVIIVGTGPRAQKVADLIFSSPELETCVDGFLDYRRTGLWRYRDIPLLGHPDLLESLASRAQIDTVVLAVEPEDLPRTPSLMAAAERMGVTVSLMPDIYQTSIARAVHASLDGTPTIAYRAVPENRLALAAKKTLDKVGAVVGLILASPIILASAIAIKLESPGPVLFKQVRSGINGRPFELLKFRTMCDGADDRKSELKDLNEMSGPVFKIKKDPRVTKVGRFLRKYSIDEVPQFLNVLRGEMSLVGPRPPLPTEVAEFEPWQRRKLSVKPGLTCIWQVSGRNQVDFEDWMRLDLQYIDNWSLGLDARILARTIPTVLKGDGAA